MIDEVIRGTILMERKVIDIIPFLKPIGLCINHGTYRRVPHFFDGTPFYFSKCEKCYPDPCIPSDEDIININNYLSL